ncbi:conserved hypothetical protein [Bathymodiolus platifrons methanotrophic gill symbiont]|uniref:hypothetical protein n=1 Tax=Bathymodiolus platifrons methanotrophic gill symbiont TaxID=113268 RepID=UPI000B420E98|nr:hypothetical protein [Bathymodiolus platifrons methanotrophic gill symbiont]GAW87426.1 conserved hypothetical protein [Bathymodiolus platifrons methanotrophic gill symbiont]
MKQQQMDYAMLMASLQPHPLSLWDLKNKPASKIHLERRLSLLQDSERQQLEEIVSVLHWARMDNENNSDAKIAAKAERVINSIDNPLLRETIIWRMELRTIMTAIRRRKLGMDAPSRNERWGYGQVVPFIRKNWQIDDFSLSHRFGWIKQANTLFETEQSVELEKLLLNLSWQHYERIGHAHAENQGNVA